MCAWRIHAFHARTQGFLPRCCFQIGLKHVIGKNESTQLQQLDELGSFSKTTEKKLIIVMPNIGYHLNLISWTFHSSIYFKRSKYKTAKVCPRVVKCCGELWRLTHSLMVHPLFWLLLKSMPIFGTLKQVAGQYVYIIYIQNHNIYIEI
jgi:hypothetical protein